MPDHPWVDSSDGANVRVSMTVGVRRGVRDQRVILATRRETAVEETVVPSLTATLTGSPRHQSIVPLRANRSMCFQGVVPAGDGFKLDLTELRDLGYSESALPSTIKPYIIGSDLVRRSKARFIIDFFGFSEEEARLRWPVLYQRLIDRVLPERMINNRAAYRDKWWIFAEPRPLMRKALAGLKRYIVTPYTAKFRPFIFVPGGVLPDAMAYAIASDDPLVLGILSSRPHLVWAGAFRGTLEDRPRYNSNGTFLPFPFPECTHEQESEIRALAEELDASRRRQQTLHPELTITGLYNVIQKLAVGARIDVKERRIHDAGLASLIKALHEQLDRAVLAAYGLLANTTDEDLLLHLIALNGVRAGEERSGRIRWLRPEFQGRGSTAIQAEIETSDNEVGTLVASKLSWPRTLPQRVEAIRDVLSTSGMLTMREVGRHFEKASSDGIQEILETLVTLGQVRKVGERYTV